MVNHSYRNGSHVISEMTSDEFRDYLAKLQEPDPRFARGLSIVACVALLAVGYGFTGLFLHYQLGRALAPLLRILGGH